MEATMTLTVTSQTQTSTIFVSRSLAVLGDLGALALFSTLGLLASIYIAIHLPGAVSLIAQFP
jgi:hypothetical protein